MNEKILKLAMMNGLERIMCGYPFHKHDLSELITDELNDKLLLEEILESAKTDLADDYPDIFDYQIVIHKKILYTNPKSKELIIL